MKKKREWKGWAVLKSGRLIQISATDKVLYLNPDLDLSKKINIIPVTIKER